MPLSKATIWVSIPCMFAANFFSLFNFFSNYFGQCFGKSCVGNVQLPPLKHKSQLMCQILFPKSSICPKDKSLILESPKVHCIKQLDQDDKGWNEDEHAYVSLIQLWIDEACKKDDFSWCHLIIMDQAYVYEDDCLEVCIMLQPHEEHFPLVSKMLDWLYWHYDIT